MNGAEKHVKSLTAVLRPEKEGGYSVFVPDLPGCVSQGETFEEAIVNIGEAVDHYIEDADDNTWETITASESAVVTQVPV